MATQPDDDLRDEDTRVASEGPPLPGEVERERTDIRVVSLLGVIALLVAVGMWFFTKDKEMIAGDGTTVTQTTGSGAQETPPPAKPIQPVATPPQQ